MGNESGIKVKLEDASICCGPSATAVQALSKVLNPFPYTACQPRETNLQMFKNLAF